MKQKSVQAISKEIYRRFPEVNGKKPKVQVRYSSKAKSVNSHRTYLLTFRTKVITSTNRMMPYFVRVVANESGKILKISMSH